MFGHRYFAARYFAPRYFGDGGVRLRTDRWFDVAMENRAYHVEAEDRTFDVLPDTRTYTR